MKQPCEKNCPRRDVGCARDCPDWAEYLKWREQEYKNRLLKADVSTAVIEGRIRCGKPTQTK